MNIILTGATSGIGKELALQLTGKGNKLAVCGRSEDKMQALFKELGPDHLIKYSSTFDISAEAKIIGFVEEAKAALGTIDVLINCAGANTERALVQDMSTEQLDWMLKVNLVAPFVFMREAYKDMVQREDGLIINILSTVALFSNTHIGGYTASKAGFDGLVGVFRKEAREKNVKICSIYPGGVNTGFREEPRPLYLSPDSVARSVLSVLEMDGNAVVDELVIRPMVEKNFK